MLRHGRTPWNDQRRIQGKTDVELSNAGREELEALQPNAGWLALRWYSSPLMRALQTARAIGVVDPIIAPSLSETNWGKFEGLTIPEINCEIARRKMSPSRGLDFHPPGGESPRMVRERLASWLSRQFDSPDETAVVDSLCVTHKGVIRSAISLATGWDMENKFPSEIDWRRPLQFERKPGEPLRLIATNLSWQQPPSVSTPKANNPG